MGHYNFSQDLANSDSTELEIARFIWGSATRPIKSISRNSDYRYDLLVEYGDGSLKTVEIKEDIKCQITGNVAVEFECRGKLSGLGVTEADMWIYKVHLEHNILYFGIPVVKLKRAIVNREYDSVKSGGDIGSGTRLFLFSLGKFSRLCFPSLL